MIGITNWVSFCLLGLLASFSPGPGVLLAASTAAAFGARKAVVSSMGNALGVLVVAVTAITGVGLLIRFPWAFTLLKISGGLYIIYLGIKNIRGTPKVVVLRKHFDRAHAPAAASGQTLFFRGLLTALLNPKSFLFFSAVSPQFVHGGEARLPVILLLSLTFVGCTILSHTFYIGLVTHSRGSVLGKGGLGYYFQKLVGLVFVGFGIALFFLNAPT